MSEQKALRGSLGQAASGVRPWRSRAAREAHRRGMAEVAQCEQIVRLIVSQVWHGRHISDRDFPLPHRW
jgi:hypothetical protein